MNAALVANQFTSEFRACRSKRRQSAYSQALELQQLLMDDARNPKVLAGYRAQVARAWRDLEDVKREMKGKPAPKPVDVGLLKAARTVRSRAVFMVDHTALPAPQQTTAPTTATTPNTQPPAYVSETCAPDAMRQQDGDDKQPQASVAAPQKTGS